MTKYGYCRVATDSQKLEEQKQLLQNEMCDEIFAEVASGLGQKPVLEELMEKLKEGDTLLLTDLDRLSRKVNEGDTILNQLLGKGVEVQTLKDGIIEQKDDAFISLLIDSLNMDHKKISERMRNGERIKQGKRFAKERRLREQN